MFKAKLCECVERQKPLPQNPVCGEKLDDSEEDVSLVHR